MKEQYARELTEGTRVDTLFAIRARDLRSARTGDAYLALELGDRSGSLPAVMFRPSSADEAVPAGTVVRVRGAVTTYRGSRRVSIDSMRPEHVYDRSDLIPAGVRDRAELLTSLRSLVAGVRDRRLRGVLDRVFGAPGFIDRFASCPASRARHHAYVGGLIEHTVAVATLCASAADLYPEADKDLVVTAALLHDVGKVEELAYDTSVDYTDSGRLLGHVVLGDRLVAAAIGAASDPFPRDLAVRLSHALLSHHGELEWGAVRRPSTIEAMLLHHADNQDAQAAGFMTAIAGAAVLEEDWTDAANAFGRPLVVPTAHLRVAPEPPRVQASVKRRPGRMTARCA